MAIATKIQFGDYLTVTDEGSGVIRVDGCASSTPSGTAGGALDGSYPNPGLASTVAGDGLTETSDVLSVNVDGSTIEINTDTLRVKDGGITSAKILDGTIVDADVNASAAISPTKISHPGGTTTFLRADATWAAPVAPDPSADTKVWMPLTTTVGGDDVLVFDASHQLIPTLTPL